MVTLEFIQKRIDGKEKEIAKLEKKLERIAKAEASGWENNPYYYSEYDKRFALSDLERAKKMLEKYRADLAVSIEKANSRNIPAILEFLDLWKKRVTEVHMEAFRKFPAARAKYEEDMKPYKMDYYQEQKFKKERPSEWKAWDEERRAIQESFAFRFGFIRNYVHRAPNPETMHYDSWAFDEERLAKELAQEADQKYDLIVERTNQIVGEITDASGLSVGEKGDLNGIIIGKRGNASVKTIGAGGYNIQCFHFRTLVHAC